MRYLDIYPHCIGCPHISYCGTVVQSTKICNSYPENEKERKAETP